MTVGLNATLREPLHDLVELIEVAVADLDRAAGVAVTDGDLEPERVTDALLEVDRIRVLLLGPAARLLRLALGHALLMRERFGLAHVEPLLHDALGGRERIRHADQRARMTGGQLAV